MKEKFTRSKLILTAISSLLLVSCGGGGGGGTTKSSSIVVPVNDTIISRPNKNDNSTDKTPEIKQLEKVGKGAKIAIIDSNFLLNKNELEKKYDDIIILPSTKTASEQIKSEDIVNEKIAEDVRHGERVLSLIKDQINNITGEKTEAGTNLQPIVSSVGLIKDKKFGVDASSKDFDAAFAKFGSQNVKVFNLSLGDKRNYEHNDFKGKNLKSMKFADDVNILDYYKDKVKNNGAIFVWAAGNHDEKKDKKVDEVATIEAAYPKYENELERGWISAVGVQGRERVLTITKNADGTVNYSSTRGNKYNILGKLEEDGQRLSIAGEETKWWSISAMDSFSIDKERFNFGSSYAAPRVSKAAALVAEKFSWMTNDQVRQTLFTTTDKVELTKDPATMSEAERRRMEATPDDKYGWGMLNQERALKGPGAFINTNKYKHLNNSVFKANVPAGVESNFENDIWGDGGLIKKGEGTLNLKGKNTYNDGSIVEEGKLGIYGVHSGSIAIEKKGTLSLYNSSVIGTASRSADGRAGLALENKGILELKGTGIIIDGDLSIIGGTIKGDIYTEDEVKKNNLSESSNLIKGDKKYIKLQADGTATFLNANIELNSSLYTSGLSNKVVLMSANSTVGTVSSTEINGMRNAEASFENGNLVVDVSRKSAKEYVGENADESAKNVAENVDKVFDDLDKEIANGNADTKKLMAAGTLQSMSASQFNKATQLMSGEIYASAQALTFAQSQNINKDLSNRLSSLDNLKIAAGENQAWFSGIVTDGKLQRDGYAKATTHVYGGQFGVDRKFSPTTDLGIALAYSTGKASFDKYAGESKSNMVGISLYGKQDLPYNFYTSARLGLATILTKVERELLDINGNSVKGKINHRDKMFSTYLELGKKIGWFTPFIGYSQDYLRRGSFNENNAEWGIKADSKNYSTSNFLIGARAEYIAPKYRLNAYVTHSINVNGRDLAYEGTYSGNNTKQKFYGVKQAKNTTWVGVGAFGEITPNVGVYGNIDVRFQDKHRADSVFSTGIQFKF